MNLSRSNFSQRMTTAIRCLALVGGSWAIAVHPGAAIAQPLPEIPVFQDIEPDDDRFSPPLGTYEPPPYMPPSAPPVPDSKRYIVYIPRENDRVLQQVRLVEPEAFYTQYRGTTVIQVGVFENYGNAQRRSRELEFYGVRSAIATEETSPPVASLPAPTTSTFAGSYPPPPPTFTGTVPSTYGVSDPYFVIVPVDAREVDATVSQLVEAGIPTQDITPRNSSLGTYLQLGPYPDRVTAQQESGYLQNFGFDARIRSGL
ncbi:SPOR domain-containing protein [Oxynema aestuarii]|jgi:cell division protein FtsN|uniref:SPOR domain-containing protein n=1 Tax=Oxynema aestuarii AP17 TaxID=2064643 RepID=A0A6H1TZ17_9CYAN|nr:hypothetical protein [Oxynema aestuarii]QIZ71160.1 hypothetical protein HCG48_11710 [Oxynema aestuarii AP17]